MTFKKRTDKSSPELSKRILVYVPAMQFIVNEGLKRLSIYIYIYTYIYAPGSSVYIYIYVGRVAQSV